MFFMAPADYTNDPYVIAKNDNLVSINSCIQVDFIGQVSVESIGTMQISGVGGQVDFSEAQISQRAEGRSLQ
ncbi:MAG: acetyl-CoA hydrolase/transferase C-terminal domain-containing protein [Lachnospiraceae bacterium]